MKRQFNMYLEIEAIEILKSRGMDNFSAFINALLCQEAELSDVKEDHGSALKIANAKLITELNNLRVEKEQLIKQLKEKPKKKEEDSGFKPIRF